MIAWALALAVGLLLLGWRRRLVEARADLAAAERQLGYQRERLRALGGALFEGAAPAPDEAELAEALARRAEGASPVVASRVADAQDVLHRLAATRRIRDALAARWRAERRPLPARALALGLPPPEDA
ncbi:MAG: hypothetical protein H6704_15825 [Myxococcales bacterium]|nr:hypothetical protein [Myxococcales bacterium]